MAGLVAIDSEVIGTLLHLWLSLITFMVVQLITFMVKSYCIYMVGGFLLHLWLVLHSWSIFITFMVGITFMVFITFMGDTPRNFGTYLVYLFQLFIFLKNNR